MPTGSKAKQRNRPLGQTLSARVRATDTLLKAWHAIRRNGETSRSPKTRQATKDFAADLPRQLRRIQERLRRAPYLFAPQIGATPQKAKGTGKRPLVIAPIEDRIVQRAILDVLQGSNNLPGVREILLTPTSIGGIPGRGVGHAISLIDAAQQAGDANFVGGSDIAGFFTKINQVAVVDFIREQTEDDEFIDLIRRALKVELANANEMEPDDLRLFPTDEAGVAQGCPLSALAGNIALREFDAALNGRNITCIRYIDDFIILGRRKEYVRKAFASAEAILTALGMAIYQPDVRPDKAFLGSFNEQFDFVGYQLVPRLYPPAAKNREQVITSIRSELGEGRTHILRALNSDTGGKPLQLYAQTLVAVDGILRAWSGSFSASRCLASAKEIDNTVNTLISDFIAFYRDKLEKKSQLEHRRALGVHVVEDDIRQRLKQSSVDRQLPRGRQCRNFFLDNAPP